MAYQISKKISWRELGDHTLIIDNEINQQVHHLNTVGSFIWAEIAKGADEKMIIERLTQTYKVDKATAKSDLEQIINKWQELKLIQ